MEASRAARPGATMLGLFLALGVPLLLSLTGLTKHLVEAGGPNGVFVREGIMWGLAALVLLVLMIGEGLSPSAIGFKRPRWSTLIWGVVGFVLVYLAYPLGQVILGAMGGEMPTGALAKLGSLPAWVLALITVRAAVVEEILHRGYAIERLTALTGSRIIGAIVPGAVFVVLHIQQFGVGYAIAFVGPVTVIMTALYLLRRDIGANMLAHFLTDAIGLASLSMMHPS
jgi:membrane protease YdiL (CAAX protease family)